MKKILTIKATYVIDDSEYDEGCKVETFEDCLNDYDNIDRPLQRLEEHGWDVKFESLKDED